MILTLLCPAKINLFLHVVGKRDDGYHLLESLVCFADYGDALSLAKSTSTTLTLTGDFAPALQHTPLEDNLIIKAHRALEQHINSPPPTAFTLQKNLPLGGGIGGGSANAAATLKGLCTLYNLTVTQESLHHIATTLGADIPVCLAGTPSLMTGIGENIAPVSLPCTRRTSSESRQSASESDGFSSNEAQCSSSYTSIVTQKNDTCSKESRDYEQVLNAVLVTPPIHVPTKDVFKALQGAFSQPLPPLQMDTTEALKTLLHNTRNDLEAPALRLFPALQKPLEILTQQHGCWLTRLSGSGATCFGLFETAAQATTAAHAIKKQHSDWWVQSTTLG